ncbi:hypothetical protein TgHK011_007646 [Trichoderma gracile]|nr:hypothetical protein TgHK011_007646 [Trichoderma gracile]
MMAASRPLEGGRSRSAALSGRVSFNQKSLHRSFRTRGQLDLVIPWPLQRHDCSAASLIQRASSSRTRCTALPLAGYSPAEPPRLGSRAVPEGSE